MAYTLRIGWSASAGYAQAIALAQRIPGCTISGAGRQQVVTVPVDLCALAATAELCARIHGWRGVTLRYDGLPLPRASWYALQEVISCYVAHEVSGLEADHCWGRTTRWPARLGCRRLDALADAPACHGASPTRLRTIVDGVAALEMVQACPAYDRDAIAAALAPARVDLPDAQWRWLRRVLARLE